MVDIKGLLKDIEEYNKKYAITENSSEADKLRHRIMYGKKSKEEWLQLREDVRAFFSIRCTGRGQRDAERVYRIIGYDVLCNRRLRI